MMNEWIISSSLLILAALVGRRLLRGRISLRLQYALWAVVLVRLLLPIQLFASPVSTGNLAAQVDMAQPVRQVYQAAREDRYEQTYNNAYSAAYTQQTAQAASSGQPFDVSKVETAAREQAQAQLELDLSQLLTAVWFAGMAGMTAVIAGCSLHLALRLKRSRQVCEVPDCLLTVYVSDAVPSPCLFGLFRPAIYLTSQAAREEMTRRHVLEHELTHYRHWDHLWSVLRSLCLVLHWYNPLVWIAFRVSRADAELACDEGALTRLGESQRVDYGRTLVGLTCGKNLGTAFVTTTMTGSPGSIRERIRLLMARPRNTVLTLTAVILVGILVVGCTFAGAPETTEPTIPTEPPATSQPIEPEQAQIDEVRALFGPDGDPWYLAALSTLYNEWEYSFDAAAFFAAGQTSVALTKEEQALITAHYGEEALEKPIFRMTNERMNQVMETYIGFSFFFVTDTSDFLFCPETAAYLLVKEAQTEPVRPEILSCEVLGPDWVRMVYRLGGSQCYAATLNKAGVWQIRSNQLLLEQPEDARPLTSGEIDQVRTAFAAYPEGWETGNPLACFLLDMYPDVTEMDLSSFIAYFPINKSADEEEFRLLQEKYPDYWPEIRTFRDMPVPTHRIDAAEVDRVLMKYAGIRAEDLPPDNNLLYLEETDCYYSNTSDAGLFGFPCTGGWVYNGGAVLWSGYDDALFLTETDGQYTIQAHLPATVG